MTHTPATVAQLADIAGARVVGGSANTDQLSITDVSLNSRDIEPGGLFAALPGTRVHGAVYAADTPAAAILTDDEGLAILQSNDQAPERRPILVVDNVRAILGAVSAEVNGHPSKNLTILGVTGTSGKTTTSYLLERGLMAAGHTVGLIGTTGTRIDGNPVKTSLTTPEATTLQKLFARMRDEGVTHVVMEVSSHALMLGRVAGTEFAVGGFTNLSQDHLDFHPTMEDYFQAKALLFDPASPTAAKRAVVCVDDEWGVKMAGVAKDAVTVGTRGQQTDLTATLVDTDPTGGQDIRLAGLVNDRFHLPLPGAFNVANAALSVGMARAIDVDTHAFVEGLATVAVPGRMERIDAGQKFLAVVDYAHKPAAVAAVLATLREQVDGRIGVVVGCGGDRDKAKRPIMGANAAKGAELVIVTDDNPRSEDPAPIRAAVVAGASEAGTNAEIREVGSRAEAIDELVAWAQPGDAVVVVGKGHEVGQIIGDQVIHFDDREEVRRALADNGYEGATK